MMGKNFRIVSFPQLIDGVCECGNYLSTVSNGIFSEVYYCKKCESIYELKLIKFSSKKISKGFLEQCRLETSKKRNEL